MKNYIFIATIIFIIGILMGLYFKISIVFLLCLIIATFAIIINLINKVKYNKIKGKNLNKVCNQDLNNEDLKFIKYLFNRKRIDKANENLKQKISSTSSQFYHFKLDKRINRFTKGKINKSNNKLLKENLNKRNIRLIELKIGKRNKRTLKVKSNKRNKRVLKVKLNKKNKSVLKAKSNKKNNRCLNVKLSVILILILILLLSAVYSNYKNKLFNEKYKNIKSVKIIGRVISLESENDYSVTYKVMVEKLNNLSKYNKTNILLKIKKTNMINISLGDTIYFEGIIKEPETRRNYNGFNYKRYLNSKNIYTIVNSYKVNVVKQNKGLNIYSIKEYIIDKTENVMNDANASICLGLVLGYKVNISEEIYEDFENSNLLHVLAISGMHVSYIYLILKFALKSISKKSSKILIIMFLIFYIILTGSNPSVIRSCIMQILVVFSKLVYRKSNLVTNMSISALLLLIFNPIIIFNIGFLFSYVGTISIVIFNKYIEKIFDYLEIKFTSLLEIKVPNQNNMISKFLNKLYIGAKSILVVTIAANILLIPLSIYFFNSFSCVFLISNLLVQPILPVIMCISIIQIVFSCISIKLGCFICFFSDFFINLFLKITQICAKLPFSKIVITTPSILSLIMFYISILAIVFLDKKDMLNKYDFLKFINNFKKQLKKPVILFISFTLVINLIFLKSLPNDLKIFFIDVGQGDSTLIITPNNKKILIDGGGSEFGNFDVGEKTLMPYLLSRKIKTLDYIFISHFDSDHVRWDFLFT